MFENTFNFRRPFSLSPNPIEDEFQRPKINPFEVNPDELPQTAKTPSVLDEYNRIIGNRPERDALKQLMMSAPTREQYKPNKMTRLGAVLAGTATGFRNPAAGVETAQNIIDRPYNEAQQTYNEKLRNVGALAGMEGEDVRTRIEGLQLGRAEARDTRDFSLRQREFDARMEDMKDKDWEKTQDKNTGEVIWINRKGNQTIRGPKVDESLAERTAREAAIARAEQSSLERRTRMGVEGRMDVVRERAKIAGDSLRAKAAQLKPGDINIKALNDLGSFISSPDHPISEDELNKYITKNEATGRIAVNEDVVGKMWGNDSPDDLQIKKALRELLNKSYSGGPTAPAKGTTSGKWSFEEIPSGKGGM